MKLCAKCGFLMEQCECGHNTGWTPTSEALPGKTTVRVWMSFTTEYGSYVKSGWWVVDRFEWNNSQKVKTLPDAWQIYVVPEPYKQERE